MNYDCAAVGFSNRSMKFNVFPFQIQVHYLFVELKVQIRFDFLQLYIRLKDQNQV